MFLIGGLAVLLIGLLNEGKRWRPPIWLQALLGGAIITGLELVFGVALDKLFGVRAWNYTGMFMHFHGYICLQFGLAWIPLSCVAIVTDDAIRRVFFDEPFPAYKLN